MYLGGNAILHFAGILLKAIESPVALMDSTGSNN